jgi:hypothetical protein
MLDATLRHDVGARIRFAKFWSGFAHAAKYGERNNELSEREVRVSKFCQMNTLTVVLATRLESRVRQKAFPNSDIEYGLTLSVSDTRHQTLCSSMLFGLS